MNLRVLQVVPPSSGGIGLHVAALLRELDGRRGIHMDVATDPGTRISMPKQPLPLSIPSGAVLTHLALPLRMRGLIARGDYDVVHAHGLRAGIHSGIAGRLAHTPCITTIHNLIRPEITGRGSFRLQASSEVAALTVSTRIIAVSEEMASHLRSRHPRSAIEVVYAAVDPPRPTRSPADVRSELGVRGRLVVTAARLAPQKDLPALLRAIARLDPDVVLAVLGEGPDEAALRHEASRLGISHRVLFLGFRSDAADVIAAADAFCLSSVWEAVALAAQEAVLLGIPVVSTDVGGMSELISDRRSGRLVPKGDAAGLADALREVLEGEIGRRYAEAARAGYETRFSRTTMLARIEELYREVASAH